MPGFHFQVADLKGGYIVQTGTFSSNSLREAVETVDHLNEGLVRLHYDLTTTAGSSTLTDFLHVVLPLIAGANNRIKPAPSRGFTSSSLTWKRPFSSTRYLSPPRPYAVFIPLGP